MVYRFCILMDSSYLKICSNFTCLPSNKLDFFQNFRYLEVEIQFLNQNHTYLYDPYSVRVKDHYQHKNQSL